MPVNIILVTNQVCATQVIHPRLQKYHIDARLSKISEGKRIDWATAEVS